jgi:hypothetical protein
MQINVRQDCSLNCMSWPWVFKVGKFEVGIKEHEEFDSQFDRRLLGERCRAACCGAHGRYTTLVLAGSLKDPRCCCGLILEEVVKQRCVVGCLAFVVKGIVAAQVSASG